MQNYDKNSFLDAAGCHPDPPSSPRHSLPQLLSIVIPKSLPGNCLQPKGHSPGSQPLPGPVKVRGEKSLPQSGTTLNFPWRWGGAAVIAPESEPNLFLTLLRCLPQ